MGCGDSRSHDLFIPGMLLSPKRLITYFYPLLLSYFTGLRYLKSGNEQLAKKEWSEWSILLLLVPLLLHL
jgi:hypothetical protein